MIKQFNKWGHGSLIGHHDPLRKKPNTIHHIDNMLLTIIKILNIMSND